MTHLNKEITLEEMFKLTDLANAKCGLGHIAFCLGWPEAKVRKVAKDNSIFIYNLETK